MTTLDHIQNEFVDSFLHGLSPSLETYIISNHISAKKRIAVYITTIKENLRNALSLTFPGVWLLLGDECANNVAYKFISEKHNLPQIGCLDDWGADFPDFIGSFKPLENLAYLKDFAAIEWLKHLSYNAKDSQPLKISLFNEFSEEDLATLRLVLHPSVFLYHSTFEVEAIFHLLEHQSQTIQVAMNPQYFIVFRKENEIHIKNSGGAVYHFLVSLQNNNLIDSYNSTIEIYSDFDLQLVLQFLFANGLISHYER
jgi:hypothetical protein